MKEKFLLRDDITYLNFGSFGACPKEIFDDYIKWQYLLESEPVQFITVDGYSLINNSRKALANFVHCNMEDLVMIPNPSFAINIIAKGIGLNAGDEILTTNLEYGACDKTWMYYCKKYGAKYIQQNISLPLISKEQFLEEFWKGHSDKTKIIFISQITSSTGLILPVKEICEEAKKRNLITIVDGAHVPAHIDLNIGELEVDYYTGACHKWMMTPKGSSFLFVKKEFQDRLDPLIISWGYKSTVSSGSVLFDNHQFNGTRDFSAYLTIPKSIEFMTANNWTSVADNCKTQLLKLAPDFFEALGAQPLAPMTKEFFGQMISAPIKTHSPEFLKQTMYEKYKIEIPIMMHADRCYMRISFQAFNSEAEIKYLIDTIYKIRTETNLILID